MAATRITSPGTQAVLAGTPYTWAKPHRAVHLVWMCPRTVGGMGFLKRVQADGETDGDFVTSLLAGHPLPAGATLGLGQDDVPNQISFTPAANGNVIFDWE